MVEEAVEDGAGRGHVAQELFQAQVPQPATDDVDLDTRSTPASKRWTADV